MRFISLCIIEETAQYYIEISLWDAAPNTPSDTATRTKENTHYHNTRPNSIRRRNSFDLPTGTHAAAWPLEYVCVWQRGPTTAQPTRAPAAAAAVWWVAMCIHSHTNCVMLSATSSPTRNSVTSKKTKLHEPKPSAATVVCVPIYQPSRISHTQHNNTTHNLIKICCQLEMCALLSRRNLCVCRVPVRTSSHTVS